MPGEGVVVALRIGRSLGVLLCSVLVGAACSGSSTLTQHSPTGSKPTADPPTSNPTVCQPGTRRCNGHDITRCNEQGTGEIIEQSCLSAECLTQRKSPSCAPTVCAPNLALCAGNTATQCKPDGSGPLPGGVDCTAGKQFCREGACRETLCVANTRTCEQGDAYVCSADGASLSLSDDCTDNERCDDDSGSCLPRVCQPGAVTCDRTRVTTCNALGSAWLSDATDCAVAGQVCIVDHCEPRACIPSTTFCRDGDLYQCDPMGASSTLSRTCRPGIEHCEVTPAGLYAFCVGNACEAGKQVCAGDVIKTCNADGSLPAAGTACAKDEYCEDAVCKPRLCDIEGGLLCKGRDIYSCQHDGPQLYSPCEGDQTCQAIVTSNTGDNTDELVQCAPWPCPPGTTGCALNQVGTCGADGATLSSVTADCAAAGKVCTTDALCAASASDTIGQDENVQAVSEDLFMGNVIDVRSARKLTELQMWLVFASPRDLRWAVFEQVGSEFVLRVDKTTTLTSSTGFVSSGPNSFNYQLEVGKRYALSVRVSGNSVMMLDMPPFGPNPSFGTLLGGFFGNYDVTGWSVASTVQTYNAPYMKVTTTSP